MFSRAKRHDMADIEAFLRCIKACDDMVAFVLIFDILS